MITFTKDYKFDNFDEFDLYLNRIINEIKPLLADDITLNSYSKKLYNNALFTIATHNHSSIVGLCALYANDFVRKIGFISLFFIDKDFRRTGLASNLMNESFLLLKDLGFFEVRLQVHRLNTIAYNFYLKNGFLEIKSNEITSYFELHKHL